MSNPFLFKPNTRTSLLFKWILICLSVGIVVGSVCAFFLTALNLITLTRQANEWLIYGLPLAGLIIGYLYQQWGKSAVKGNNLLLNEYYYPHKRIPFIMAPLVLLTTLLTHLVGGSAGREGTAVQMGGSMADQLTRWVYFSKVERRILISIGISAGFSAVFGTPLAGAIFGLELFLIGKKRFWGIIPCFVTAFIAHFTCQAWHVPHTHYDIEQAIPSLSFQTGLISIAVGILFGITAWIFRLSADFFATLFKIINYAPLRPFIGGFILLILYLTFDLKDYQGLGISTIQSAFTTPATSEVFILKIILTTFTLAAGFKGGEVTPLFFIGATLGSFLSLFFPLPIGLLAAMGFVAVFAGATNTPLSCILMGTELFGTSALQYIILACFFAFLFSGKTGIYTAQKRGLKSKIHQLLRL